MSRPWSCRLRAAALEGARRARAPGGMRRAATLGFAVALLAGVATSGAAQQAEPPAPSRPPGPRVIRDARLAADSTVLLHEWPALTALQRELRAVRPAIEAADVRALARLAPGVRDALERIGRDTLPAPLAPRAEEVRGRLVAIRAALAEAAARAAEALAAPAPPEGGLVHGDSGPAAGVGGLGDVARLPPGPAAVEMTPPPAPVGPGAPAPADTAATPDTAGGFIDDPRAAYLEAWRDVTLHGDALVHVARNPAATPPAPEDRPRRPPEPVEEPGEAEPGP